MSSKFEFWQTVDGINVWKNEDGSAIAYEVTHVSVDADGAPNAYGPADSGLDFNANAGYPDGGWKDVLVQDPVDANKPFRQGSGDPYPGFFVSMTSFRNQEKRIPSTSSLKYVDAVTIPYFVYTQRFFDIAGTGGDGDLGYVWCRSGSSSGAVMADVGGTQLGEISVRLAEKLSGKSANPRNATGAPPPPMYFVVFPKSRVRLTWPLNEHDIQRISEELLQGIGGPDVLAVCWSKTD